MVTLFSSVAAGSSPTFFYSLSANETGRTSTTVTYSVTVSARLEYSNSYYGSYVNPSIKINGTSASFGKMGTFSGTTTKSDSLTMTVPASAGASSLSYTFSSYGDYGSSQGDLTKSGTIACSVYALTPSLSGTVTIKDGSTTVSSYYRENLGSGSFFIQFPAMTNANGTKQYEIQRSINGGSWANVDTDATGGISNAPGVSTTSVRYRVRAKNIVGSAVEVSGYIYSNTVKKNVMTSPSLSSSAVVYLGTKSFTMTLGKATDNLGSSMSYSLTATNANTVVRGTSSVSPGTLTVNTNNGTSGTYMTLDDMKKTALNGAVHSDTNDYKDNIALTITATNDYGTKKTDTVLVPIDLGRDASVMGVPSFSLDATSYFSIASVNRLFPEFRPLKLNITGPIRDELGRACSFDVYMKEGTTDKLVKNTGVATATIQTTVNHTEAGMLTAKKTVSFFIRAKTYNGKLASSAVSPSYELHYYKNPSVTTSAMSRTITGVDFKVTITPNTSLTGVSNTSTMPTNFKKSTSTIVGEKESYTVSNISNLAETYTAQIILTIRDSIGFALKGSTNDTKVTVKISKFRPALAIREKGIGINTYATDAESLRVNGNVTVVEGGVAADTFKFITPTYPNGRVFASTLPGDINGNALILGTGGLTILGGGESANFIADILVAEGNGGGLERTYMTSDSTNHIISGMTSQAGSGYTWVFNTDGSLALPNSASVNIDQYGNLKAATNAVSGSWNVIDGSGTTQLSIPLGSNTAKKITLGQFRFHSEWGPAGDEGSSAALVFREFNTSNTEHILVRDDTNGFYFNADQAVPTIGTGNLGSGNGNLFAAKYNVVSDKRMKENIVEFNEPALPKLRRSKTYQYDHKMSDEKRFRMKKKGMKQEKSFGLIAQEAPEEITINDGTGIDLYAMSTMILKGLQELADKVDYLEQKAKKR